MHTPGPWEWEGNPNRDENYYDGPLAVLRGPNGEEICSFGDCTQYYPSQGVEPQPDDARLIAAAPELLEALCELKRLGEHGMTPNPTEWLTFHDKVAQIASAAIAKAEGKP